MPEKKRFIVLGAGAIGSVFGAFLAGGGHDVTLIGRKPHLDAIERDGLRIEGLWGDRRVCGFTLVTDAGGIGGGRDCDFALVTVKSYATRKILEEYGGKIFPEKAIVLLQNGIGGLETAAGFFPEEKTAGGRVIFGAETTAPGRVRVTVEADSVVVGWNRRGAPPGVLDELAATLTECGITTRVTDDIHRFLWEKALYNCALNPLSAVLGMSYGELAACAHTRAIMDGVIGEMFAVMDASGVKVSFGSAREYMNELLERLIP
ncbi:MAG: ketopantoate reductase family protein, partial [bacterium]